MEIAFIVFHDSSDEGHRVEWHGKRLMIGRRDDVDIQALEPTISSLHAEIVRADNGVFVRDLDSLNGTHVNGDRIGSFRLRYGDVIRVGKTTILVTGPDGPTTPALGDNDIRGSDEDTGSTIRVELDHLRSSRAVALKDDYYILLLRDLFESLGSLTKEEQIFDRVREILTQTFDSARVFVLRRDEKSGWRDDEQVDLPSTTFVDQVAQESCALLATSLPQDHRFAAADSVSIRGIQTAIAAPAVCEGDTRAVLCIDRLQLPAFTERDLHVLGIATNHVSAVLDNVSRIGALERARARLASLNRNLEALVESRTAKIRHQAEEIRTLADAKDELIGMAAHDIRGPLMVIQGTTELLQMQAADLTADYLNQSLGVIHDASAGLGRLLTELLDAKAIESGKVDIQPRLCRVSEVVSQLTPAVQLAAANKKIVVEIDVPVNLTFVADPQRLAQALNNLLLNAVKFSDSDTTITVLGRRRDENTVSVSVIDQGIGIPEDEFDSVFSSFAQGRAGKNRGGSGLGLVIAHRLIELLDGTLHVTSKVGVGSCFRIDLPRSLPIKVDVAPSMAS